MPNKSIYRTIKLPCGLHMTISRLPSGVMIAVGPLDRFGVVRPLHTRWRAKAVRS